LGGKNGKRSRRLAPEEKIERSKKWPTFSLCCKEDGGATASYFSVPGFLRRELRVLRDSELSYTLGW